MKRVGFKQQCEEVGISYSTALNYRKKHPELINEQVIQYLLTQKEKPFRQKCLAAGINYNNAIEYRKKHPKLTDNEVLAYYIPNSYVNWDDELIIDGKIIDFDNL
jgi:hypothetical protein